MDLLARAVGQEKTNDPVVFSQHTKPFHTRLSAQGSQAGLFLTHCTIYSVIQLLCYYYCYCYCVNNPLNLCTAFTIDSQYVS